MSNTSSTSLRLRAMAEGLSTRQRTGYTVGPIQMEQFVREVAAMELTLDQLAAELAKPEPNIHVLRTLIKP